MKNKGFTLAEMLITLGVIGVVAALTIPNLIKDYRIKQLETAFKTTDAMIQEALKMSLNELGYTDIRDFTYMASSEAEAHSVCATLNQEIIELNNVFLKQFKDVTKIDRVCDTEHGVKNILGDVTGQSCDVYNLAKKSYAFKPVYLLPSGVAISNIGTGFGTGGVVRDNLWYNEKTRYVGITVSFDTNGPYKGPNRLGYDIFTYVSHENVVPPICNPYVRHSASSGGCYQFASANKSPLNSSEPYWDLLYKPRSYWENYNK